LAADECDLRTALEYGELKSAAQRADVALEHIKGHAAGAFDGCDPRLTHPNPLGELPLREPCLFPQGSQTRGQPQLLLDLRDTLSSVGGSEDLLLLILHVRHERFLFVLARRALRLAVMIRDAMTLNASVTVWPKDADYPNRALPMAPGDIEDLCVNVTNERPDVDGYDLTVTYPDGATQVMHGEALPAGMVRLHDLGRTGTLHDILAGNVPTVTVTPA
jgi:hypothetical protein